MEPGRREVGRPADADLTSQVSRWAAEEAARESAGRRARTRELTGRDLEAADFRSVAGAAAAPGVPVGLSTTAGHDHRGRVVAVGSDYLGLATARGEVLVPLRAVVHLETEGPPRGPQAPATPGPGDRSGSPALLLHALERLAGTEREVQAWPAAGGHPVAGELVAVGADFLCLVAGAGSARRTLYVRLEALAELWLFMSG